ncbi:MAG: hypothetical protein ACK5XP_04140, partial [Sphingobacteriia bacterium]
SLIAPSNPTERKTLAAEQTLRLVVEASDGQGLQSWGYQALPEGFVGWNGSATLPLSGTQARDTADLVIPSNAVAGNYSLEVRVTDTDGKVATATLLLRIENDADLNAPSLSLTTPGSLTDTLASPPGGTIPVAGTVDDGKGTLAFLQVLLIGATGTPSIELLNETLSGSTYTFSRNLNVPGTAPGGIYRLTFLAFDRELNERRVEIPVRIQ